MIKELWMQPVGRLKREDLNTTENLFNTFVDERSGDTNHLN